jgi:hypothetical protein
MIRSAVIAGAMLMLAAAASAQTKARTLEQTVADYVGLYNRSHLEEWKTLFHPDVFVAFPDDESGTIVTRDLEKFYGAQKRFFDSGAEGGERLENVQFHAGRRIARVTADFIFWEGKKESRGKLGLHLVESAGEWKIVAVVFSYDHPD